MPLVKFPSLFEVIGECWLDPLEVTSICPLRGLPAGAAKTDTVDISKTIVIGCRVQCAGITFDLSIDPNAMAQIVELAHSPWPERVVSPRAASLPN